METPPPPLPIGHRRFIFGKITIDSNFDSGNCAYAQKINWNTYDIWVAPDHKKYNYRSWFHFKVEGVTKGTIINFCIKNMQNQYRLLQEGLVPVVKDSSTKKWQSISHKINLSLINLNNNEMEWVFSHQFTSNLQHTFALFFPWSNIDNQNFLTDINRQVIKQGNIYFHRGNIMKSIEGMAIEMLTISSKTGVLQHKFQDFDDTLFFQNSSKPNKIQSSKKRIIITARVHPGEVPGSHVMTGIIETLTGQSEMATLLRDKFVFHLFPILNPDGVRRGNFRVDTNGVNLNRCYLNPSAKDHPSIYAVRKVVLDCHKKGNYFAFLDLHAQGSRGGNFIYGNSVKELSKQVQACLFPKILSMNSQNFQYEGSNFLEKHMHYKQKNDHISKIGCGRVALYYATKNINSWTLQCSYSHGQTINILQPRKQISDIPLVTTSDELNRQIINNLKTKDSDKKYRQYTLQTYKLLGKQILQSFLELIESNPVSRIANPKNHFKNLTNLKMSLAMALMRMAPTKFEPTFRKIYFLIEGSQNQQIISQCYRALYLIIIQNATLPNLQQFLKLNDNTVIYSYLSQRNAIFSRKTVSYSCKWTSSMISTGISKKNDRKTFRKKEGKHQQLQSYRSKKDQQQQQVQKNKLQNDFSTVSYETKILDKPMVKIIDIDKQVYSQYLSKQNYKVGSVKNDSRYISRGQITSKDGFRKKNDKSQPFKEQQSIFRLRVFPKMMSLQKAIIEGGGNAKNIFSST